jgi:hypothetical protein
MFTPFLMIIIVTNACAAGRQLADDLRHRVIL